MTAPRVPLNTFKLVAKALISGSNLIYNEPVKDISAIVLSTQITNVSEEDQRVSVKIEKTGTPPTVVTLLNDGLIPPNESLNPLAGKLVMERGDKLLFITNVNNSLEAVLSVLENANN